MTDSIAPAIVTEGLHVVYQRGAQPAVDAVDLSLTAGDGLLVAGDHGAGKSTLLRALLGLVRFGGEVRVLGAYPGTPGAAGGVGYGPQGKGFALGHTPRHLVKLVATLRAGGRVQPQVIDEALAEAGIGPGDADRPSADVELIRRVALACAVAGQPKVLILDDPWEFAETIDAITAARGRGAVVVAATHDPGGLPAVLGRTLTLVDGRVA